VSRLTQWPGTLRNGLGTMKAHGDGVWEVAR